MTGRYKVVDAPAALKARAERLLAEHAQRLGLDPAPHLRFVKRTTSISDSFVIPGLGPLEAAAGFVRRDEPNTIYLNVGAPLAETLAHEARHVWQARRAGPRMWSKASTRAVEDDASEYASVTTLKQSLAGVMLGVSPKPSGNDVRTRQ